MIQYLLERRVLKYVNTIRTRAGEEPLTHLPKGRRGDKDRCPIANSSDSITCVRTRRLVFRDFQLKRSRIVVMPTYAQDFVKLFDLGLIPGLNVDISPSLYEFFTGDRRFYTNHLEALRGYMNNVGAITRAEELKRKQERAIAAEEDVIPTLERQFALPAVDAEPIELEGVQACED